MGTYLGTGDAISARKTAAAGSTLRGTGEGVSVETRGDLRGFGGAGKGRADVAPGHQREQPGVPAEMLHWGPRWGIGSGWGRHHGWVPVPEHP